jgi:hypothetical protein
MSKFKSALEIYNEMIDDLPSKRPNCREILKRKILWAFRKNDFKDEKALEAVLEYAGNENLYNCSIIQTKLEQQVFDSEVDSNYIQKLISVMESLPKHEKLQIFALSILQSYKLQTLEFDKLKCIQLILDSLVNFIGKGMKIIDISKAIDICSKLLSELSIMDRLNICLKPEQIKVLLIIINSTSHSKSDANNILGLTLDLLMELTDSSSLICEMFSNEGGIDLYLVALIVRYKSIYLEMLRFENLFNNFIF